MNYASSYLRKYGQQCTILRPAPIQSFVSLKRSTKATFSTSVRENFFEGLIEASSNILSGECFTINGDTYITQTIDIDYHTKELELFCIRANGNISIKRKSPSSDEYGNITETWLPIDTNVNSYQAYIEIVTRALKNIDTGILDNTIYTVQLSKLYGIIAFDRVSFEGKDYRVDSIDNIGTEGVVRAQLSLDTRG